MTTPFSSYRFFFDVLGLCVVAVGVLVQPVHVPVSTRSAHGQHTSAHGQHTSAGSCACPTPTNAPTARVAGAARRVRHVLGSELACVWRKVVEQQGGWGRDGARAMPVVACACAVGCGRAGKGVKRVPRWLCGEVFVRMRQIRACKATIVRVACHTPQVRWASTVRCGASQQGRGRVATHLTVAAPSRAWAVSTTKTWNTRIAVGIV